MKKLFIIGNGFDLAHKLPTSYFDFKNWILDQLELTEVDRTEFEGANSFLSDLLLPQLLLMPDGREDFLKKDIFKFFFRLVSQLTDGDWSDFESSLGKIVDLEIDFNTFYDKEGDIDHFKNQYYLEDLNHSLIEAISYLKDDLFPNWVKSLPDTEQYRELSPMKKAILRNKDSLFLTFNYTMVLEEVYQLSEEKICHIHGSIADKQFIYGHGYRLLPDEEPEFYCDLTHSMNKLQNALKKPVMELIAYHQMFFKQLIDIEEIYFIGFNLSDPNSVDAPYFKEIFKVIPNIKIYVDKFDIEKRIKIIEILSSWGAKKAEQLKFVDTDRDIVIC
ncbi:MAG: AbiH family protein [Streptococcus orisratti]|uniref:AbiH family protein n=1 Tax=Streptococcus orisratti TaxID=114652 RepID=UPI002A91DEE5|nr:AbiH family protein [Streptococcus orisratti]MDY5635880.1 AbiH family protein [Streptococcus orisratti]